MWDDAFDDDIVTIKYSSSGQQVWVQRHDVVDNRVDQNLAIGVDTAGNVIVSGVSYNDTTGQDIVTIKYAPDGSLIWLQRFDGPAGGYPDRPTAVVIDTAGNVYVAGRSGYPDFAGFPSYEYCTIKYSPNGVQQWAKHYRSSTEPDWGLEAGSFALDLAVDPLGNVYVTGYSNEDRQSSVTAIATIKYNAAGDEQWVQRVYSILRNIGNAIAVDQWGNSYVTGLSAVSSSDGDCYTIKYGPDGVILWERRYAMPGGGRSLGQNIAIDRSGHILVSAVSNGGSSTGDDFALLKYAPGGDLLWAERYDGPGHSRDVPTGLALDTLGNAYVTGHSTGTVNTDFATLKYSSDGLLEWEQRYDNPAGLYDIGRAIAVTSLGEVYVTGNSHDPTSGSDYVTLKYAQMGITRPRPGERWISGRQDTIRWTGGLPGEFLDIEYTLDSGQPYRSIDLGVAADSGYYIWSHQDSLLSTRARIRLLDFQSKAVLAESDTFRLRGYVMTRLDATGQYEPFTFGEDRWSFGNIRTNMWPLGWWSQFDYQEGNDPHAFYPYPDWEPFESAPSPFFPDWPLYVRAFGIEKCYWGNPVSRSYKQAALATWDARHRRWAGSCSGLSLTSILSFDRKRAFRTRYPEVPDFADLNSVALSDSIRLVINELAQHWDGQQHQAHVAIQSSRTPTQTINDLKTLFLSESGDHAYLYFANNQAGGAHAIVPYKVTDSAQTSVHFIHVYDNSWPLASTAQVRVDTALNGGNGAWSYALWPGWGGAGKLYVMDPASTYLTPPISPTLPAADVAPAKRSAETMIEVIPSLDMSLMIYDAGGDSLGYSDSTVSEGIAGARADMPPTGSVTPPYSYLLPGGAYTIRASGFADSLAKIAVFTDSTLLSLSRADAKPGQEDHLRFDNGLTVRSSDPDPKSMKLRLVFIETPAEEKVFAVENWSLQQSDSISFEREAGDALSVRNLGTDKSYSLAVVRASEAVQQRFLHPRVELAANSSHIIAPAWDDLSNPAAIYIDFGIDGTIDDTLALDNTVSATERGSVAVPRQFELAQNYPNPFNPVTKIRFTIADRQLTIVSVYDLLGQEVATLVNEVKEPGTYEVAFDASGLASGVYLYRLQSGDFTQIRRMTVLK
jgi:hypothetical protein